MSLPAPQPNASAGPSNAPKDVESMSSILMDPLNELQTLSQSLFLSLSPPQTKPPPPPPLDAFLRCDRALADAINVAQTHQVKQRQIEALETEILGLEDQWRKICEELAKGKEELEEMIEEGVERLKAIEQAKKGASKNCTREPTFLREPSSIYTLSRIIDVCAKPQRLHICTPKHARFQPSRPTTATSIFSSVSQRRENAARPPQCGSTSWPTRRDTFSRSTYVPCHLFPLRAHFDFLIPAAPNTVSPKIDFNQYIGANPYRQDRGAPRPQFFDLDLDLNPDL
jgi:mediator of RNA polymerase II transcription subunit 4